MRKLLLLLFIIVSIKSYSQKVRNDIFFSLDTSLYKKPYNLENEVSFEKKILKTIISDTLKNRNLEFIRIDNKNYFLTITNNLGQVLEEGKVSLSRKPFLKDTYSKCFYFQKNGYWREFLTDSIYKSGVYKYNKKVGTWTNILRSAFIPLSQETYEADTVKTTKNLNQLEGDKAIILNNIIGKWGLNTWNFYDKPIWTFVKLNVKKNESAKTTIDIEANYTAKSITREHHGGIVTNYNWKINTSDKTIVLESTDEKIRLKIFYLNDRIFLLNSKNLNN